MKIMRILNTLPDRDWIFPLLDLFTGNGEMLGNVALCFLTSAFFSSAEEDGVAPER